MNSDLKRILLVATHEGVTHEVEDIFVKPSRRSGEIQFDAGLGLKGESLDGYETRREDHQKSNFPNKIDRQNHTYCS